MNCFRKSPTIWVCVVNWNGRHHFEYCLPSLALTEYPNLGIVVVDNASTDMSLEYVHRQFPDINVVECASNLMWAGGNNVGIRLAMENGADWIMLANNDILVDPRWAECGMKIAETDAKIGIIGYDVIGGSKKADMAMWHQVRSEFKELSFKDVLGISGCFMLVKCEVFRSIGFIDETYKLYGEDNDFEARAVKAGYRSVRCNLPIWHLSEGSSARIPFLSSYMATRNELRFLLKQRNMGMVEMLWWYWGKLRYACDVPKGENNETGHLRRARPSRSIVVNAGLVSGAFVWNILHLRGTRAAGRRDEAICAEVRRRNGFSEGPH